MSPSGITRAIRILGLILAALLAFHRGAAAEPRVALVIGNSSYGGALGELPNPANDARLMAKTLTGIGFAVIEAENADQAAMKRAIQAFGAQLADAGAGATGLFFYAGHGLQVAGTNYLIPVQAKIQREADVDIEAISVDMVMKQMAFAGSAVNIVILDACRNNPLARGLRAVTQGLADPAVRPEGSFIAYSTAPGDVAEDGKGANSPFTTALAAAITKPGASINDVFQAVRGEVRSVTNRKQVPWDSSSLTAPFYFVPAAVTPPSSNAGSAAVDSRALELAFWNAIKDSKSPADYQAYLEKYPDGDFAPLARIRAQTGAQSAARVVHQAAEAGAPVGSGGDEAAAIEGAFWDAVRAGNSAEDYQAYLRKYPNGLHAEAAQAHLASLDPPPPAQQPAAAAPPPLPEIVAASAKLYAKDKARLRAAPLGDSAVVARLAAGTPLEATGRSADGAWWRVKLADGRSGFAAAAAVTDQPPSVAVAPAPAPAQPAAAEAKPAGSDSEVCYAKVDSPPAPRAAACNRLLAAGIADDTDRYNAMIDLGQALYDQGRDEEAIRHYRDAIDLDPKFYGAYYLTGLVRLNQSRFAEARAAFDKAVSLDPQQADPLLYRGATLRRLGELDAAQTDMQRALEMKSDDTSYYEEIGYLHLAQGDLAAATADTDRALKLDPDTATAAGVFALYLSGRTDEGLAMVDRAIKDDPRFLYWWIWKAMIQRAKGDAAGATATLAEGKKALASKDWPAPLADYMAGTMPEAELRRLGHTADAKAQTERNCEIEFYVGVQALRAGDKSKAAAALKRSLATRITYYIEYTVAAAQLTLLNQP